MNAVTVKDQVTIPRPVRDALPIGPGSLVEFAMNQDGQVVLRKAGPEQPRPHPFYRVVGSAGPGMTTDEIMALPRGDD